MTVAREQDISHCPDDCHSCPACCHDVNGPAQTGSGDVKLNGRGVLRSAGIDQGTHCCCCSSNEWKTMQGSSDIYLDGVPLVRLMDKTQHCGGIGQVETSSPDTNSNY